MGSRDRLGVSRLDGVWGCLRTGSALCVLTVLAAVAVPLGLAPSALAAEEAGQIGGRVTDALTQAPIEGIEVCAQPSGEIYNVECATTGINGEYTLAKLAAGAYTVQFFAGHGSESELDYASQYYNDKSHRSEGESVTVTAGATTSGIDAEMQPGGKITGLVTDAVTHAPLEGIQACTGTIEEADVVRCADTNANGEYTLSPLATGEYVVEFHTDPFEGFPDYARQYYDDQEFSRHATKVGVTTGGTTSGIDAAMQLGGIITGRVTSAATQDPIEGIRVCEWSISEESAERCPETNANGEYTLSHLEAGATAVEFGEPFSSNLGYVSEFYGGKASLAEATPLAVTPGVTIAGIDASLHAVGEETVKPPVVETTPTSGVPTATPLLNATPLATLMGAKLVITGNTASVHVVCSKAACQGSVELMAQAASKRHKGKTAAARKETLVLAAGSFSLAEGKDGSVMLRLTSMGKKLLTHASRRHPVAAELTLFVANGRAVSKSVLVG